MIKMIAVTPTITAGAYSAGDAVGGKMEFEDACTPYSNTGYIVQGHIMDKAKQDALLHLVLFDRDFTATADNAAFTVTDADLPNIVGVLSFAAADYIDFADNSIGTMGILSAIHKKPFVAVAGGTSLFGQLFVETSTPTYVTTTDLIVELIVTS